jgi:tRNA nucleotidyltransferase (CCA-adding enzyme)
MKKYIVGGAVRDKLLGKTPNDIDYVVVGATPEEMLELGFEEVGADFPVFLHPITRDEYALARTERKNGLGYTDFVTKFDKTITLEDDLLRRDLTVNAMAQDENGVIIDPFGGQKDLKAKKLRHVSEAFKDDPLRILRVARFCAKMKGFTMADETKTMLQDMVANGEIDHLKPERIWKEFEKAMVSDDPARFLEALDEVGALKVILPEIYKMKGIPQRKDYHAEGDVFIHVLMVLREATKLSKDLPDRDKMLVRMSALLHDIGKAYTPAHLLYDEYGAEKGSHFGHDDEKLVTSKIQKIAERMRMPKDIEGFCIDVAMMHQRVHTISKMSPKGITKMLNELNIRQKAGPGNEERYINNFLMSCYADSLGRKVLENDMVVDPPVEYPQQDLFRKYFKEYANCSTELQSWIKEYSARNDKAPQGELIKDKLHSIRVNKITQSKPKM